MSDLDEILELENENAYSNSTIELLKRAAAELAALRARVLELEAPKTCATCRHSQRIGRDEWRCNSDDTPLITVSVSPSLFGCIHHAPAAAQLPTLGE